MRKYQRRLDLVADVDVANQPHQTRCRRRLNLVVVVYELNVVLKAWLRNAKVEQRKELAGRTGR